MKDNQTIAQFLNVKDFPLEIKDNKGNQIYLECSDGYWDKSEHNAKGNQIYYEDSNGYWAKREYDIKGNEIYREDSDGYWCKIERDDKGGLIYCEDSKGTKRPKPIIELTLEDIAKLKGVDVSQIRIKE